MTEKIKKYLETKENGKLKEELLNSMKNEEIDYLISKSTNTYEKIFMSKFKERVRGVKCKK
ncbi:MAG: hypothetical protein GX641_02310 [Mollicutes bacterium]|jgi:hypothetical protein|nr:hypothetical protein [Mollicutes bacterium]